MPVWINVKIVMLIQRIAFNANFKEYSNLSYLKTHPITTVQMDLHKVSKIILVFALQKDTLLIHLISAKLVLLNVYPALVQLEFNATIANLASS